MPANIESCLDKAWVTEPYSLQVPGDCKEVLRNYVRDHWREVVAHWDAIAITDKRKWVLLSLSETLNPNDYMDFLKSVRELRESEEISSNMFETATLMPGPEKESFLALNYQNPRVRNYIKSIRGLVSASQEKYLDELLSGVRKQEWEERYHKARIVVGSNLLLSAPANSNEASSSPLAPSQPNAIATPMAATEKPSLESGLPIVPTIIVVVALVVGAAVFFLRKP